MATAEIVSDRNTVPPDDVAKRVVCLRLGFSTFGVRRRVDTSALKEISKGEGFVHVGKDIIASETLNDIRRLSGEVRGFVVSQSVPARFLRGGIYLEPAVLLERIDDKLRRLQETHSVMVDRFVSEYESGEPIASAQARLEPLGLFNPKDYPSAASVRSCFKMEWQWLEFGVPDKLRTINRQLWEEEKRKAEAMWQQATEDIRAGLRAEISGLVTRLISRLEPDPETGKRKVMRSAAFDAVDEFLSAFPFRNVTEDSELAASAEQLRLLMTGVDLDRVKKYDSYRNAIREKFEKVGTTLEQLVQEAPERSIRFEDDGDA